MLQALDKSNFSIVVTNEGAEDSSEFWQDQCKLLYDSIAGSLHEGSIKPLELEGAKGERVVLATLLSTLAAAGITGKVFVDVIIECMKTWLEYRPTAEIELKCPDGSTVIISKLPLSNLSKYFEENPKSSICESLNRLKSSSE